MSTVFTASLICPSGVTPVRFARTPGGWTNLDPLEMTADSVLDLGNGVTLTLHDTLDILYGVT